MKIWKEPFGTTKDGVKASKYFLENTKGTRAVLSDFGVTLLSLCFSGKDVILGYDTLREYETQIEYFGATVGRFAGPIPGGKLQVGEKSFQLTLNGEDGCHAHGGVKGFSFRVWESEILSDGVRFSLYSPDGEEGYPGNLTVSVTCCLTEDDGLRYIYDAVSDQDTVLNMTCHAYFNLEGHDSGSVLAHSLQSPAAYYQKEEPAGVPQLEVFHVADTPFDFRTPHTFGCNLQLPNGQLDAAYGYDRNGYLGESGIWKQAAKISAPVSGITLEVLTNQSGMQLYCPGTPLENHPGKDGVTYQAYQGFCIEPQYCICPEKVQSSLLHPVLSAAAPYHCETIYQFYKEN